MICDISHLRFLECNPFRVGDVLYVDSVQVLIFPRKEIVFMWM